MTWDLGTIRRRTAPSSSARPARSAGRWSSTRAAPGLELGCGPVKLFPHFIGIDKEASIRRTARAW
jgi:hypothetical protein